MAVSGMKSLESALKYLSMHISVIPVGKDKRPVIKSWEPFQKQLPTREQVFEWFSGKERNVAIVTGEISDVLVVDADTPEAAAQVQELIPDSMTVPMERTPRGGTHFFFRHDPRFINRANYLPKIDVRTQGGYVVVDPSMNGEGHGWKFLPGLSLFDVRREVVPADLFNLLINAVKESPLTNKVFTKSFSVLGGVDSKSPASQQTSTTSTNVNKLFRDGFRNEALFHVAHQLIKAGTSPEVIVEVAEILGEKCDPPWGSKADDGPIIKILESAEKHYKKRERPIAAEVREWVLSTDGDFLSRDVQNELHLSTREEKKACHMALKRLSQGDDRLILKKGTKAGSWTTLTKDLHRMDFINANLSDTVQITLPLEIHKKTVFFPKSVIIVAGVSGFGKSTFALRFIADNMEKFGTITYFNSEMSPEALKKKLSYFEDHSLEEFNQHMDPEDGWTFRSIGNCIRPNQINVIDYLEPEGGESYSIHGVISEIINHLDRGIALITVQKKPGSDLGEGGIYSVKAASLALTLDWGTISIYKNRFREEDERPDLKTIDFDIVHGSRFAAKGGWYDKGLKKNSSRYKDFGGNDG